MTGEEFERMLLKHDEVLDRIELQQAENVRLQAENEKAVSVILRSQTRFESKISRHDDAMDELRVQMSEIQKGMARHTIVFERNELRYEQFLQGFNQFMPELLELEKWAVHTNGRLVKSDERIDEIAENLKESVARSNERLDRVEANLDRVSEAQARTDENLDRLAEAQIKTDEQIRALAASTATRSARKSSTKKGGTK